MVVLSSSEVKGKHIVQGGVASGWRASTYDATVGCIMRGGVEISEARFTLPPRSIVWIVSAETFKMPDDVTGLATLKTQWTHEGLLALNVGVIDPGWDGPLSTALVNFGNADVTISKGEPFFRILFHSHAVTTPMAVAKTMDQYKHDTAQRSRLFSPTFLNMDKLTQEVSEKVLHLPRWGYILTLIGVLAAFLAIFVPIAISVWTDYYVGRWRMDALEKRMDAFEAHGTDKMPVGVVIPPIVQNRAGPARGKK